MQGNSFNFLDDDPEAVDCIVQYFYTFDYKHRPRAPDDAAEAGTALQEQSGPPAETPASDASVMVLHVKVYALAEKYSITPLKALALEKFRVAALDIGIPILSWLLRERRTPPPSRKIKVCATRFSRLFTRIPAY